MGVENPGPWHAIASTLFAFHRRSGLPESDVRCQPGGLAADAIAQSTAAARALSTQRVFHGLSTASLQVVPVDDRHTEADRAPSEPDVHQSDHDPASAPSLRLRRACSRVEWQRGHCSDGDFPDRGRPAPHPRYLDQDDAPDGDLHPTSAAS